MKTYAEKAIFRSSIRCFTTCVHTAGKAATAQILTRHMRRVLVHQQVLCAQASKRSIHLHVLGTGLLLLMLTERTLHHEC